MRLCVVDDHRVNLAVLVGIIRTVPGWQVEFFADPLEALGRCGAETFDLVLVDYQMPGLDGIEFTRRLRTSHAYRHVPVVMVTGDGERAVRLEAIRAGATDFLQKPIDPEELRVRLANLLELRRSQVRLAEQATRLAEQVAQVTLRLRHGEMELIQRLARAIEYRDDATGGHVARVARISALLSAEMGFGPADCAALALASHLHDAGKIGLPDRILLKAGPLDPDEIALMRHHTTMGGEMLRDGESELLRLAHDIALCHHERWDGAGYPRRLAGPDIPLAARIVAVADVIDALRSPRPYKPAWTGPQTRDELARLSGLAFDPACVAAIQRIWTEIEALYDESRHPPEDIAA